MPKAQDFPISVEMQFLAGLGDGRRRTTGNMCSLGTEVDMDGRRAAAHCVNSTSPTFERDQWVRAEAIVWGDSLITHVINGDTVLRYNAPRIGGGVVNGFDPAHKIDGTRLTSGYIALQGEGHPVEFRREDRKFKRHFGPERDRPSSSEREPVGREFAAGMARKASGHGGQAQRHDAGGDARLSPGATGRPSRRWEHGPRDAREMRTRLRLETPVSARPLAARLPRRARSPHSHAARPPPPLPWRPRTQRPHARSRGRHGKRQRRRTDSA
jgi:hypothetical protein